MDHFFRFEQVWILFVLLPALLGILFFRRWYYRPIYYLYSLGSSIKNQQHATKHPYRVILNSIRCIALLLLVLLIAKPQLVDSRSNMIVHGIDIMLVLDMSGSMENQDYSDDDRSRFDIAKQEAIRFSEKRVHDAIGLVIFGNDALSRCPLTLDKTMLADMISALHIGDIDKKGTLLASAVVTAVNRLKHATAENKIMILLTDGEPSLGDMSFAAAIEIAKKFKIKVYAIGIGSDRDKYFLDPSQGLVAVPGVNSALLQQIARETGGIFFMARDEQGMRRVYETIDGLEKTKHEAPLYTRFIDMITPIVLVVMGLFMMEQILATFIWFSI